MTPPTGSPSWLVVASVVLTIVGGGGGLGALVLSLLNRRAANRKTQVEGDEVFTRIAVTLVEPLEHRLAAADRELETLRARVREAAAEADDAVRAAHRLRLLVQQWHRAIMDPAATLEWLRQLVGPTEPTI